jgi:nitrite reductase/ring-hydroxylating ferredoxin subunit
MTRQEISLTTPWQPALPLTELPVGQMKARNVGGRDVLICHTRDGLFALDNICTHASARMSEGRLRGSRLICPLHGASFDARTGKVLGAPAIRPLVCHGLRVVDGMLEVRLAEPGGST